MRRDSTPIQGLGDRLRNARVRAGLYQHQLAHLLHTDQKSISFYERDLSTPSLQTLVAYCLILGVSPNELLEWDTQHEQPQVVGHDVDFVRRNF